MRRIQARLRLALAAALLCGHAMPSGSATDGVVIQNNGVDSYR